MIILYSLIIAIVASAPYQIVKFTLSSYILPDKSLKMEIDVRAPRTPGTYPTIVYMTGLEGLIPSAFYSNFINSIA